VPPAAQRKAVGQTGRGSFRSAPHMATARARYHPSMLTCFYYWLIQPLRTEYEDTSSSTPLMSTTIHAPHFPDMTLAILGDSAGPTCARLTIPNLPAEELPSDLSPILHALREHLLSTLRLTLHPEAALWGRPIWTFATDPASHHFGFSLNQEFANPVFDARRARNVFDTTFDMRDEVRLFLDGADRHIPLQYRYLSLYKLLELHFRSRGHWRQTELRQFLEGFAESFRVRRIRATPFAHLTDIRDRCAHIKTGRKRERTGVTQLSEKDMAKVSEIMPVMGEVAVALLNLRGKGKFTVERRAESWLQWH